MSRETMSEEERRRRRNEASRRCYLKRKAELAAQAKPVGVKDKKPKTKAAEAKPTRRGPDPIVAAERLCRTYAKVANGVKPMIKDAAEFLGIIYKSEDQRVVEKVERILSKGLGVKVCRLESDPIETTRVCIDAASKAVKTPKFRLTQAEPEPEPDPNVEPEPQQDVESDPNVEPEPEIEDEPAEVPVDPAFLEKVDAGEADKSEIEIPQDKTDEDDEDDEDEIDSEDDEDEDDEDEDDEDDESEEAQERRTRRRRREESDNVREYESGRWEMMGEMGAQGAFDD